MTISVIIPTMDRHDGLIASVSSLHAVHERTTIHQVVIVDNTPDANAAPIVERLIRTAPFPIDYAHAPEPGVANARNVGVAKAKGEFIAFLDDDERAEPAWLAELIAAQKMFDADVVFGGVRGWAPTADAPLRPVVEAFFSRNGPAQSRITATPFGCGNSLLRVATTLDAISFDVSANRTGGEDDILFAELKRRGCRFAWAPQAIVYEDVAAERANLRYLLVRGFARGQGPSQTAAAGSAPIKVLFWMAVGALQLGLYAIGAIMAGGPLTVRGARYAVRAAEGAGKLLWFRAFEPKLYGASQSVAGSA